ncbi:MAG: ferrous iron transport protein A [Leptospiraceae bacterium]|nr:ferrous iron transport protein A [Leptospiraceae bacterium]
MSVLLSELKPGESAFLESMDTEYFPASILHDILDYGLIPGTKIKIIHKIPGQKKITIAVGPAEIVLRNDSANHIRVKVAK